MALPHGAVDLSPPVNFHTDRSKSVLLLWIICVFCVLCFSCFRVCSMLRVVTCWERTDLLALVGFVRFIFVTFPCGILGQIWYLILSFPDLCRLSDFGLYCVIVVFLDHTH